MTIHCNSSRAICLLYRPNRWTAGGCGRNHHPSILQVLFDGTNLCKRSRNMVLFLVYYFPRQRWFYGLPISLFHHNSPNSTAQGTNVGILSAAQYVSSNYAFRNWGHNTFRNNGPKMRWTSWAKIPLINWPTEASPLTGISHWHFGSPVSVSVQNQCPSSSHKVCLFPFPQCTVTLVKGYRFLWGRKGEKLTVQIAGSIQSPSSRRSGPPFIQGLLGL